MKSTFNPTDHLQGIGVELVNAFKRAGKTTHPGAVGSGREKTARDNLRRVLPFGVGVGSGFVIDSFGGTTQQCDIIIYEEQFALKFAINDDEQYAYYNCENVIAVGEVKSDASIVKVRDSIKNLKSVRELKRLQRYSKDGRPLKGSSPRQYLGNTVFIDGYNPDTNYTDQIFTFLICKSFKTPVNSILTAIQTICDKDKTLYPNRMLSIDDDYCFWVKDESGVPILQTSAMDSTHFTKQRVECVFGHLVSELTTIITHGNSVPLNNSVYFPSLKGFTPTEHFYAIDENEGGTNTNA
jgi:hypothetical protein